jgi:hypothetical protein
MSVDSSLIDSFGKAISDGLNDVALNIYDKIRVAGEKANFKTNAFSSLKGMEDFGLLEDVLGMEGSENIQNLLGLTPQTEFGKIGEKTRYITKTGQRWRPGRYEDRPGMWGGREYINGGWEEYKYKQKQMIPIYGPTGQTDPMGDLKDKYSDPFELYFEVQKENIMTRINNTEKNSDEWFVAQNDLFNLMLENAQHLKDKAEKTQSKMEDMFDKIEETMRMRVAEERETTKGDFIFVDAGAQRDTRQMLDDMIQAVKTNDPSAQKAIEEFRKKMLNIR